MIAIKKMIFETPQTIPEMVETIVTQGMLEETNYKTDLKLTENQVDWINEFIYPSNKIVHLRGERRSGRTSMGVGMVLTTCLFQHNSTSMIMTVNEHTSQYLRRKVNDYLKTFQEIFSLAELSTYSNRNLIGLVNGSKILFENKRSECAVLGRKLDNLFLDFPNTPTVESIDDEFMSCIIPSILPFGKLIISLGD